MLARNFRRGPPREALLGAAGFLVPVFVVAVVAYLPWYLDFSSQAGGFAPYVGAGTRPAYAFLQFSPLLGAALLALTWGFHRVGREPLANVLAATGWLPLLPLLGWMILSTVNGDFSAGLEARGVGGWLTLALYGGVAWLLAAAALLLGLRRSGAAYGVALLAVGAMLLYGAELFVIKDVFFGSVPRLNTVFKLSYQAWILLSLGGSVAVAVALQRAISGRSRAGWLALPVGLLGCAGLVYPLLATANRTDGLQKETAIDGLASLARSNPAEYALTRWIQENTDPGDVVIEASGRTWRRDTSGTPGVTDAGNDYSNAGRISARTGRPTPLGWYFHEIQWRGETPANRARFTAIQDTVDRAYLGSPAEVLAALRKTGAKYLVIGGGSPSEPSLERSKYIPELLPDYAAFLDVAFEVGDARVYALPEYRERPTS